MRYSVILADPPWEYRVIRASVAPRLGSKYSTATAFGVPAYNTMPAEALKALPISAMAERNAALFLWVTMPCLPQGIELVRAWGFEYKTVAFTWAKQNRTTGRFHLGLGHYTRGNAEICLLGIRGSMRRRAADVPQLLVAPRREHSRKPDEQYARIMRLFDGPYLEVFARQTWPGWDVWGNQAGKFPAQPFLFGEQE